MMRRSAISCLMSKRATLHLMHSFLAILVRSCSCACASISWWSAVVVHGPEWYLVLAATDRRLPLDAWLVFYGSEVVKLTIFNNFVIGRIVKYSYARLGHLRPGVSAVVLKHGRETCLSPLARTTDSVEICDLSSWARHNHGHYELVCTLRWSDT